MEKKNRKLRRKKKIESITRHIHDIISQIPELKSKADTLEKQATSVMIKQKIRNQTYMHWTGSLKKFLTKDSREEKEARART